MNRHCTPGTEGERRPALEEHAGPAVEPNRHLALGERVRPGNQPGSCRDGPAVEGGIVTGQSDRRHVYRLDRPAHGLDGSTTAAIVAAPRTHPREEERRGHQRRGAKRSGDGRPGDPTPADHGRTLGRTGQRGAHVEVAHIEPTGFRIGFEHPSQLGCLWLGDRAIDHGGDQRMEIIAASRLHMWPSSNTERSMHSKSSRRTRSRLRNNVRRLWANCAAICSVGERSTYLA